MAASSYRSPHYACPEVIRVSARSLLVCLFLSFNNRSSESEWLLHHCSILSAFTRLPHLCLFIAIFLFIPTSSCPYLYIFIKSRLSFQFDPFFCDSVLVLIIMGHFYQQYAPSECSVLSEVKGHNLHGLCFY